MLKRRYLHSPITKDLKEKMVFLGGPRQVGKTTLAKQIGKESYKKYAYFNWDNREDRKKILGNTFPAEARLLVFDEIHKYRHWKNYLKGEFDTNKERYNILATGSARMDLYRRGGDSLMGRYHYFRIHPFSLEEILNPDSTFPKVMSELKFTQPTAKIKKTFSDLFSFGGFPEPFMKKSPKTLRRFHNERLDRLVREDIRDLEQVHDLSALQILVEILPERVGSLLSINSIAEDLQTTYKTASSWINILERFYYHFKICPYAKSAIRSLRKESKIYLWDWSQIDDEGARFENLIASHLLKLVHLLHDWQGYKAELFFLRDLEKRETDFLVTVDKKPWIAIEAKLSPSDDLKNLNYFSRKLEIPFSYQVTRQSEIDYYKNKIRFISADKFLSGLI